MTSEVAPSGEANAGSRRGRLPRAWRTFRRWRRGRPFWGGLFLILGGTQLFLSSNLSIGDLKVHFGPEGFLSYLLPILLWACGILVWLTPQQRIFYGVIGALTSVYSLIGLNLGGFFIGMILGVVGSSLAMAWTPVKLEPVGPGEPDEEPDDTEESTVGEPAAATTVDELLTGPLTDVLPQPRTGPDAPAYDPRDPRSGTGSGGGPSPRRSPPLLAVTLVPLTLAAAILTTGHGSRPAQAAPCPPKPSVTTTAPNPPPPPPSSSAPSAPSPSPSVSPSPSSAAQNSNPIGAAIGAVVSAIGGLLGLGGQQEPTPTPTPTPTASPSPAGGGQPAPAPPVVPAPRRPTPSCAASPAPKPRTLAVPPGQPIVSNRPGTLTGDRVTMSTLSFDGVVDLPTHNGTIRVLQFSMRSSTTTNFKLVTLDADGRTITLTTDVLTVEELDENETLKFYTSRFTGKVLGLIELTFTPDSPPPLVLPDMFFTDVTIALVYIACDRLTARPILHLTTP